MDEGPLQDAGVGRHLHEDPFVAVEVAAVRGQQPCQGRQLGMGAADLPGLLVPGEEEAADARAGQDAPERGGRKPM